VDEATMVRVLSWIIYVAVIGLVIAVLY